jgi:flavin-dependent dehydrogenase
MTGSRSSVTVITDSPDNPDSTGSPDHDVVVVGARCAGCSTAAVLARAGARVVLVDRDPLPSDTVSTHQLFPDSLAMLDRLGALSRLTERHRVRTTRYSWRVLGHAVAGGFTPVDGQDRTMSVRRVALDAALQETAVAAGAVLRERSRVVALVGAGTVADPVRGVVLADGTTLSARWVVGADGRRSTVARLLGLRAERERRGAMSMLLAYWEGLPPAEWSHIEVHETLGLQSAPCEDGLHLLSVTGPVSFTRGSAAARQTAYLAALRRFPASLNARLLDRARQVTPVTAVPETMLRGGERPATGPGWVLVGDAGLVSHPSTGQGIGDALAHGRYVGDALAAADDLSGYAAWRAERARGHHEFSFRAGRFPEPRAAAVYAGLAEDTVAGQEFLDTFTKTRRPDEVLRLDRVARYDAAWAYEAGVAETVTLLQDTEEARFADPVPACPGWTVRDLAAHLAGVAEDSVRGAFFPGALVAWQDPAVARARDAWTAGHLRRCGRDTPDALCGALDRHGRALVAGLRRGGPPGGGAADGGVARPRRAHAPSATSPCTSRTSARRWGCRPRPDRSGGGGSPPTGPGWRSGSRRAGFRRWCSTRACAAGRWGTGTRPARSGPSRPSCSAS